MSTHPPTHVDAIDINRAQAHIIEVVIASYEG